MKSRLTSIFLLISLTVPVVATFSYLHFQKKQIKRAIKHRIIDGLSEEKLVHLSFTKEEASKKLKWEHSKEFEYNGEMYDVVKKRQIGNKIHYWCWWDNEETILNKQLHNVLAFVMGDNPQKRDKQSHLLTFFKSLYCQDISNWTCLNEQSDILHYPYLNKKFSLFFTPPTPPPELG